MQIYKKQLKVCQEANVVVLEVVKCWNGEEPCKMYIILTAGVVLQIYV